MDLNADQIQRQLREFALATVATRPAEIDCDEWLERVGTFLELLAGGEPLADPLPEELAVVAQHIEVCPACREELEAMIEAIRAGESSAA